MTKTPNLQGQGLPDPQHFNLASFADLLPRREPIIGEDTGSFDGFRIGLIQSLHPSTPYEFVIAENLIRIEWELLQHRAMREACILRLIKPAIIKAVRDQQRREYEQAMDEAWEAHVEAGGAEDGWAVPYNFDGQAADELAKELIDRAMSRDPQVQSVGYAQISELGLSPLELLSEAHRGTLSDGYRADGSPEYHDTKIQELERRRREIKRDFDQLRQSRSATEITIEQ